MEGVEENKFTASKTSRYYTLGRDITTAKRIWFACHGYGQLAAYFIKNFHCLDPVADFVIAPEGANRFYVHGFSGRVGATWMTSEARLDDINDYVAMLDAVAERTGIISRRPDQKLVVLGFSQGVATAIRWMTMGNCSPDAAVFWAGAFPPDLEPARSRKILTGIPCWYFTGNRDNLITESHKLESQRHLSALDVHPVWVDYDGGHEMHCGLLMDVAALLDGSAEPYPKSMG